MNRTLIIGDIHGCINTFKHLLYKILDINTSDRIIILGDLIDRGPKSKDVVDELIRLQKEKFNICSLRGNHEQMLIDSSIFKDNFPLWSRNGGAKTCESFKIKHIKELPNEYIEFFKSLPNYIQLDKYLLVHAGLNFDIDNPLEDKEAMLWVRNNYIIKEKIGNRKLIVGHTPQSIDDIKKGLNSDIIKLDGGCVYYGYKKNLGDLVALDLENFKLFNTKNKDYTF
jgi:serine/threonine protein phosphatase 1